MKITLKLSILIIILLSGLMSMVSITTINSERKALKEQTLKAVNAIVKNLAANAKEPLILENLLPLDSLVSEVAKNNKDLSFAAIINKDGNFVAHTDLNQRGQKFRKPDIIRITPDGFEEFHDSSGHRCYYFEEDITKMYKFLGRVSVGYSVESIFIELDRVRNKLIIQAVIAIIFGIIMSYFLARFITRPIGELVRATEEIAKENFDIHLTIKSKDELGILTSSFNKMAKDLASKELVKAAFQRYVSSQVLERILKDPDFIKKLGGERKMLTIFFSDIRGFTPMSEKMKPEEVISLLNDYLNEMTEIIFENSGVIDKFIGDAIMVIYGALQIDLSPEEQVYCAVKTGLEMQNKLKELQDDWEKKGREIIKIGIGINTGEVVVGNVGSNKRLDYTAIGDNVNLAQRLEANAKPGQLLISQASFDIIKDRIEYEKFAPLKVKGKQVPIQVYNVLRLKS